VASTTLEVWPGIPAVCLIPGSPLAEVDGWRVVSNLSGS
jgi:hypothetical protein